MLAGSAVRLIFILLLFFNITLLMLAPASAQEETETKIVIAAADFQNNTGESEFDHLSKAIPSSIITNLAAFEQFKIVERSQLKAVLDELALSMQGIVDKQTAAKVGKHAGATLLIIGDFVIIGNEILINARLVEVTTSEVRAGIRKRGTLTNLLTLLDKISADILEELQGEVKNRREGKNQLPTVAFTFSPQRPTSGGPIIFDASESSDPDGDIVLYEWDFTSDGVFDKMGKVLTETFFSSGQYPVTLKVTDNQGGSSSTSQTIQVREGQNVEIGELAITSNPSNAMVFIGGEFKGTTPKIMTVRKGSYDIVLRKENYEEWREEISVESNQHKEVFVQLIKKTGNHPPTAVFHFSPSLPAENDTVVFDASASRDPDGLITDYRWDFDGDGVTDAWGLRVYRKFSRGRHVVSLIVVDDDETSGFYRRELEVRKQHIILENSARFDSLGTLTGTFRLSGLSVSDFDVALFSRFDASGFSNIGLDITKQIIDIEWFNLASTTTLDVSGSYSQQLGLSISTSENLALESSATFNLIDFHHQYGHIILQATMEEVRLQGYAYFRVGRFSEGTISIDEIHVGDFTVSGYVLFYYEGFNRLGFGVRTKFMEVDLSSTTIFDASSFSAEVLEVSGINIGSFTFSGVVEFGKTGFDRFILGAETDINSFTLHSTVEFDKAGFDRFVFGAATSIMGANLVSNTEFDARGFQLGSLNISKDFGNIAIDSRVDLYRDQLTGFLKIRIVI